MPFHGCTAGGPCPMPPHPDKLKELADAHEPWSRHFQEPETGTRPLGLNDGTIFPPSHFKGPVSRRVISQAARTEKPLRGPIKTVVVLAAFKGTKFKPGAKERLQKLFFSTKAKPDSMSDYYTEVSGGLVSFVGDVVGPVQLPHDVKHYANGNGGFTNPNFKEGAPDVRDMADDALTEALKKGIDLSKYDNKNHAEGYVDAFVVVHNGVAGELPGSDLNSTIWSVKWMLKTPRVVGTTKVNAFMTMGQDSPLGTAAHEMGHLIFGWDDLYGPDKTRLGVGDWCLMSRGGWLGYPQGFMPCHPSAVWKVQQGWLDVRVATGRDQKVTLNEVKVLATGPLAVRDVGPNPHVYRLWADGEQQSKEYFLIECRKRYGFDQSLPGEGLLIWHIDESVLNQNDNEHLMVSLMNADTRTAGPIQAGTVASNAGNPFPGVFGNRAFTNMSVPSSLAYNKKDAFVSVTNISDPGLTMTMDITVAPRVASKL